MNDLGELLAGYAREVTEHHPVPGGVVVVVDRDRTRLVVPFGVADVATGRSVTEHQLFQIGSISKSFAALAVLALAAEGRLGLDDPVTRWLPWVDLGPWTVDITLRHLLSHTAGLIPGGEGVPDPVALAWTLRERAAFPPGQRFHYSNHGYLLVGLVVAAATGRPLAEVLHDRVLEPLGIADDAAGRVRHADRAWFAVGHTPAYDDRPWVPGDPLTAAPWTEMDGADGCVALDAVGLARYLRALLGDGSIDGGQVLPVGCVSAVGTPTAPAGEGVLTPSGYPPVTLSRYGLGLNVEAVGGHDLLTHGGGNLGYASFLLVDRDLERAVGVLTNANGDCAAAELLARVTHLALLADELPERDALPPVDLQVRSGDVDPGLLGRFRSSTGLEVELGEGDGAVVVRAGGATGRLWATLSGRYVTDHPLLRTFHLDPDLSGAGPARWCYGGDVLGVGPPEQPEPVAGSGLVGHYRSWTPWYPTFRVVAREGRLLLSAPGGVEAPAHDEPLVAVGPGQWRIGEEAWRPERLVELAHVDGAVVLLDRDGARYSRTTTP